ncbi:MAG: hypothetical protein IT370_07235 [Deltaproteobacteria bacterium]|nr:hypothetical protein [Deltaproteobacteria bacterium]
MPTLAAGRRRAAMPARAAGLALALALALAGACSRDVELVGGDGGRRSDAGGGDGGRMCSGLGPPLRVDAAGAAECGGAVAAASHRHALCSCAALTISATLQTRSFDSTGLTTGDQQTAALGVNQALRVNASLDVGGALVVADAAGISASAELETTESLRSGGPLTASASEVQVGGDAFVAGDVAGQVKVTGVLHVPTAATVAAGVTSASVLREPVSVAAPCDCSAGAGIDPVRVAAAASAASGNDNASIGLDAGALVRSDEEQLELPCGRFHLTSIDLEREVELRVHGRTVLVVSGDVMLREKLDVVLDAGAELDLVVAGTLRLSGGAHLGSLAAPARVRIWLGGTGTVVLDDHPTIGAVLHAPRATISAPAGFELHGSVLAGALSFGAGATVRYDRSILGGGVVCGVPASAAVR